VTSTVGEIRVPVHTSTWAPLKCSVSVPTFGCAPASGLPLTMACDDAGTASIAVQAATAATNLAMIAFLLDADSRPLSLVANQRGGVHGPKHSGHRVTAYSLRSLRCNPG